MTSTALTIRRAQAHDDAALERLAALDSTHAPAGTVLVAEVGGEPWAAVSVDDFHAVADPFRPSADVTFLLLEHARRLRRGSAARSHSRTHFRTRRRRPSPRPALG